MTRELVIYHRPSSDSLHPFVYWAATGLALWFVVAAWILFGAGSQMELMLTMVSVLMLMAIAIPFALWLIWRKSQNSDALRGKGETFRDWASGDFDTWQGRFKGAEAAIEILLPLAAVAFGITAIGIVLHITATGAL
ncbi:MAG: hypothetical protein HY659_00675 [Rhizobiales bacterium]|nr:hypothetical protein [Hyphomicrobiales bacterium]